MRRVLLGAAVALSAATVAWLGAGEPPAAALGPADALGQYVLRLRGDGFDRDAETNRVSEGSVKGSAVLTVALADDAADPRELAVEIRLDRKLAGSLLDRATPTPALSGRGVLVGDSLTVIGAGQANFVNAVTLRFRKRGARLEGWWLASFPGSAADRGFVAGLGLTFRGRRVVQPAAVSAATR